MSRKILFIAHMQSHIMNFHIPVMKDLHDKGYEIYVATKLNEEMKDNVFVSEELKFVNWQDIDFNRNPFSINTLRSFSQLNVYMKQHQFDLIHLNTPIASFIGRLSALYTKNGPSLYMAHGFHFYEGAPLINWLLYYPIEKIASYISSGIITINREDFYLAKSKFKTKNGNKIFKMDGVGIDPNKYFPMEKNDELKQNLGFESDDFVISMVGEINSNKNQIQLIKAIEILKRRYPNIKALLIGDGDKIENIKSYIKERKIEDNIKVIGYRKDIPELLSITDILASLSKREGLPKNIMEGMACRKPLIATNIRGSRELIRNGKNGYLVSVDDIKSTAKAIEKMYLDKDRLKEMGNVSFDLSKKYYLDNIIGQINTIYKEYIEI